MNFIERVMRVMTHINIGAALGLMAWVLWSGWQVVTGQIVPAYRAADLRAAMAEAHAVHAAHSAQAVPAVHAARAALPPCHDMPAAAPGGVVLRSGADL